MPCCRAQSPAASSSSSTSAPTNGLSAATIIALRTYGDALSALSISAGEITWPEAVVSTCAWRPTGTTRPSASIRARSPVANQPSSSVTRDPSSAPDRDAGAAHEELLALEADLDGGIDRRPGRAEVALAALRRHDPARLDLAVLLADGDAERPEPAQRVGRDEGAADARVAHASEPGLALHGAGHEVAAEPGARGRHRGARRPGRPSPA